MANVDVTILLPIHAALLENRRGNCTRGNVPSLAHAHVSLRVLVVVLFIGTNTLVTSDVVFSIIEATSALTTDAVMIKCLSVGASTSDVDWIRETSVGKLAATLDGAVRDVGKDEKRDSAKGGADANDGISPHTR